VICCSGSRAWTILAHQLGHDPSARTAHVVRRYTPEEYPTYANYPAIHVSHVARIPMDYDGDMGVPITFLAKYNPSQFEVVGNTSMPARSMKGIGPKGAASPAASTTASTSRTAMALTPRSTTES